MTPLAREFEEFLRLLNTNTARYLVVGGYAVGYHGYLRNTDELDLFVELSADNAARLVSALREFGFHQRKLKPALFLRKGSIIRLGGKPMCVQIHTEIDGVSFEECYRHRHWVRIGDLRVNFIGLPQLLRNKRARGSKRDLWDIEGLIARAARLRRPPPWRRRR